MSYLKIYYERWTTPRVRTSRTVAFDTITGTGPDPNYPYDFRLKFNNQVIWDKTNALSIMSQPNWDGKTFYQANPILPKLPAEFISTTIWKNYPENTPEPRESYYRCHFKQTDGKIALTMLPGNPENLFIWNLLNVYEFTDSLVDGNDVMPNPAYPPAKAEYDAKYAEYLIFFQDNFALLEKFVSPKIPTEEDNQKLIPSILTTLGLTDPALIPDKYFYHWWFVNPDGTKTPTTVVDGQYKISPIVHKDGYDEHPYYKKIVNLTAPMSSVSARLRYITKYK